MIRLIAPMDEDAELLKLMRVSLKHEGYDQIPQLECPAAAKKKKLLG
jgi:hypothetical protein